MLNEMIIFDKPYTPEKIAEGRAVVWAISKGLCFTCKYVNRCGNDHDFEFPQDSPCMKKKIELLQE